MKSESIIKLTEAFDLNSYEAKTYLALLEKDSLSAVEATKISGVPRGRIYEILDNLLGKGLCHSIPGKIKKYKASDPAFLHEKIEPKLRMLETEIEKEKQEFESEIERRRREFESEIEKRKQRFGLEIEQREQEFRLLKKKNNGIVEKLTDVFNNSRGNDNPLEYMEIQKNPDQIMRKLIQLISEAKKRNTVIYKAAILFQIRGAK
jgi:sugar-specific transcriptional regulator TrmB